MPEQFLNRAQIRAAFKQMGGETVPQGMHGYPFGNSGLSCSLANMFLQRCGVEMMPSDNLRPRIDRQGIGWKGPLPDPFIAGIGIFPGKGVRQVYTGDAGLTICLEKLSDLLDRSGGNLGCKIMDECAK